MYRIIFTIVAVLLFVAPSQAVKVEQGGKILTEHAVQQGGKRSPLKPNAPVQTSAGTFYGVNFVTETPACATPFTNFPATFEGSGTCTSQEGSVILESGSPNCNYTTTALSGSESAILNTAADTIWFDLSKTITTPVRIAFLYQLVAGGGNNIVFSFGAGGIGRDPRVYSPWSGGFRIYDVAEGSASAISTSPGVGNTRKICIEWNPTTDDTTFSVDLVDGEWCAGADSQITLTGPALPDADVNRFIIQRAGTGDQFIVDDVTACDVP